MFLLRFFLQIKFPRQLQQVVITAALISTGFFVNAKADSVKTKKVSLATMKSHLPTGQFDLEAVIGLGALFSSSFNAVKSEAALIETPYLDAQSSFTTKLSLSAFREDSTPDVTSAFSPTDTEAQTYNLTLSKYFTSGTGLELSYDHLDFKADYSLLAPAFSSAVVPNYFESKATLTLTQSLLKDSFGSSSRRLYKAGKQSREAQKNQSQLAANRWFLDFSNQLYNAWSAQRSAKANYESYQRRLELLKIARINKKRGTINNKDFLQLSSAVTASQIAYENSLDKIQSLWQTLVIALSLPAEWGQLDAIKIPLQLDEPMTEALKVCNSPVKKSLSIQQMQLLLEASKLAEEARKKMIRPELNFVAKYSYNGIAQEAGTSNQDLIDREHPTQALGVEIKMPFSFAKEKSDYLKAYSQRLKLEAQLASEKDRQKIILTNACRNLSLQKNNLSKMQQIYKELGQRERLEHRDFKNGRTTSFNYIQAGVDAIQAQLNLIQAEVALRRLSWSIISANKGLSERIQGYAKAFEKSQF